MKCVQVFLNYYKIQFVRVIGITMNTLNNIVVIGSGMKKYQYFLFKVIQTHLICKETQTQ